MNSIDYNLYPSEDFQKEWLSEYLRSLKGGEIDQKELQLLYVQVNKFALVRFLFHLVNPLNIIIVYFIFFLSAFESVFPHYGNWTLKCLSACVCWFVSFFQTFRSWTIFSIIDISFK